MRIAIVGAGLAGLAIAWHLRKKGEVTLFGSLGGGASGVSTGLLHPFPGKMALRSGSAKEGMGATLELLDVAEKALGRSVAARTGIFRFALQEIQQREFPKRNDPDAIWRQTSPIAGSVQAPGLWIPQGITVYNKIYLQGLFQACIAEGVRFEKAKIDSLEELADYDRIVLCAGHETLRFVDLPLEPVKGQTLLCRWKEPLPFALIGNGHITPTEDPMLCQIGSTYEHGFKDELPHKEVIPELLSKAAAFYPPAKDFEVLEVRAGIRLGRKGNSLPTVFQADRRTWVFTGLGSRGLLYHAMKSLSISERF